MKFMQINEDTLDFITSSIPVRNSKDPLEIPEEFAEHPEVARALKVDSIRVWVEPETPTNTESEEDELEKLQQEIDALEITKPDDKKDGE
jgi:hypothetical protein